MIIRADKLIMQYYDRVKYSQVQYVLRNKYVVLPCMRHVSWLKMYTWEVHSRFCTSANPLQLDTNLGVEVQT